METGRPILYRDLYAPAIQAVIEASDRLADRPYSISLRGRDLEGAYLQGGRFPKVDFRGTNLRGANLRDADLREALLSCFRNPGDFICTNIQFAEFSDALMQGADFTSAKAQGAYFSSWESHGAQLQKARFFTTKLAGAVFYGDLSGADFQYANLAGAYISGDLVGTNFESADLSYADLSNARLIGINLDQTRLVGAGLLKAQLWRIFGTPILKDENEAMAVDCRGAKKETFTHDDYTSFLDNLRKVPATLDRPFYTYRYIDPDNTTARDSDGSPVANMPPWLEQCMNYDPARQNVDLATQYVHQICSEDSDLSDRDTDMAMWPRHDHAGRFNSIAFEEPVLRQEFREFYRLIFSMPECADILAVVRARDSTTNQDLFHEIWGTARLSGIDDSVIAAAIGDCDDCGAVKHD